MAIIAIAAAATLPRLTVPYRPAKPAEVAFLEEVRARAIQESQPIMVLLKDQELITDPGELRFSLPPNHLMLIARPKKSAYLDQHMVTIFYPDGTTTWGEFAIAQKDGARETVLFNVKVDPLHGEIVYAAP